MANVAENVANVDANRFLNHQIHTMQSKTFRPQTRQMTEDHQPARSHMVLVLIPKLMVGVTIQKKSGKGLACPGDRTDGPVTNWLLLELASFSK